MLGMSQTDLGHAVGVTFQQVQKYEKGTNRISASRLQQIARVLQVPVTYFFDDLTERSGGPRDAAKFEALLATSSGLSLVRAFTRIKETKLRRRIVELVQQLGTR
jgi:transcriptional regulator with XRE-family HTH domain